MPAVLVNTATVLVGSLIGILFRNRLKESLRNAVMKALGLCTLLIGISSAIATQNLLCVILCMVVGTVIGELLKIDDGIEHAGDAIKAKLMKGNGSSGNRSMESFTDGFVSASILFCIGSMTIMGSLEAGIRHDYSIIYAKSMMDFVSSMVSGRSDVAGGCSRLRALGGRSHRDERGRRCDSHRHGSEHARMQQGAHQGRQYASRDLSPHPLGCRAGLTAAFRGFSIPHDYTRGGSKIALNNKKPRLPQRVALASCLWYSLYAIRLCCFYALSRRTVNTMPDDFTRRYAECSRIPGRSERLRTTLQTGVTTPRSRRSQVGRAAEAHSTGASASFSKNADFLFYTRLTL